MDANPYRSPRMPAAKVSRQSPNYGLAAVGVAGILFWAMTAVVACNDIMHMHVMVAPVNLAEIVGSLGAGVALCIALI